MRLLNKSKVMNAVKGNNLEKSNQKIGLLRLLAACVYEFLILIALWMATAWLFITLFGDATHNYKRLFLQLFLWLVAAAYFVWCWIKSGQTLATQAWKIKLVNSAGTTLSVRQAVGRYVFASVSTLIFGLGFFWAIVDKDHCFLHDRLLKSRFISVK